MGSGIEHGIGFFRMFFLYFITGLGGITLSMCCRPGAHAVGASTAVFGLVGYWVSYQFTHFQYMNRVRFGQFIFLIVYCYGIILMNLNIGPGADPHVDNNGHLGGLITGIMAGVAISEQYDANAREAGRHPDRFSEEEYKRRGKWWKYLNRMCQIILILWFVILMSYFWFVIDPDSIEDEDDGV